MERCFHSPAGWCGCEAGLQHWLQPPSVVRFLSSLLFSVRFLLWITPFVVSYFSHPCSGCFHESLKVLSAAIQAQSIITDRLLVYGFLINKWPIVSGHHGIQCGTHFYFGTIQEPCYKYYCVETFVLQNYFHSQSQKIIEVMGCSPEAQLRSQVFEQWGLSGGWGTETQFSPHVVALIRHTDVIQRIHVFRSLNHIPNKCSW